MVNARNRQIAEKQIRVVDDQGTNLGVMDTDVAIDLARAEGKDLIEISKGNPPVCKIIEFGKFKYELKKSTKIQKSPSIKEFHFNLNIDPHDLQIKAGQIKKLLEKGHPIKIAVIYHGREITHKDAGYYVIDNLKGLLSDFVFDDIRFEEKQLLTNIKPK